MQYTRCIPRMHYDSNHAAHGSHPGCTLFLTMQYTRCTPRMHSDSNHAAHGSHPECTLFLTTQNTRCTPRTHTVSKPEHMEQKATTVELRTKYRPSSPCLAWKRQMKKSVREPRPEGTGETQSPSVHKHHSSTIPL